MPNIEVGYPLHWQLKTIAYSQLTSNIPQFYRFPIFRKFPYLQLPIFCSSVGFYSPHWLIHINKSKHAKKGTSSSAAASRA